MVHIITKDNYDALVAQSPKPVLLDFWADWCGPCRMMAPTVEAIAQAHPELAVGKVNVDEEGELTRRFAIESIPTLVALRGGVVVGLTKGVQSAEDVLALFE